MKQRLELIVVSEIDHDRATAAGLSQQAYERALKEAVAQAIKDVLSTPKNRTIVEIEYGESV